MNLIKNEINHLSGVIGPVMMFEEVFSSEVIKKIYELEEEYEMLLYRSCDFGHINISKKH